MSSVEPKRSIMVLASYLLAQTTMLGALLELLTERTSKEPSMMTKTSAKSLNLKSILTTVKGFQTMD